MSEKPEALRLADALHECKYVDVYRCQQAAAELRRQFGEIESMRAERDEDRKRDYGYSQQVVDALTKERDVLRAQRDALLEALRVFVSCALPVSTKIDERGHWWTEAYLDQALPIARAAIAKAEGNT